MATIVNEFNNLRLITEKDRYILKVKTDPIDYLAIIFDFTIMRGGLEHQPTNVKALCDPGYE